MKKLALVIIITVITSVQVWAETKLKLAEELLTTLHTKELLEQSIAEQLQLQINAQPDLLPYKKIIKNFLDKYMGWESVKGDLIILYSHAYSESELSDIIKFYRTPVGKKMLQQQPFLAKQGAMIGAKKINDHREELTSRVKAEAARIKQQ
jgi:hypothetical protein